MAQLQEMTTREGAEMLDYLREKVATSCRILAQHRIVKGSMGHVSTRVPGTNDGLVRGRPQIDKGLRFAEPSSIIRVGTDSRPVGQTYGVRRVSEIYLHMELYKRRPDVNAVIHAHDEVIARRPPPPRGGDHQDDHGDNEIHPHDDSLKLIERHVHATTNGSSRSSSRQPP